jgi:hypothetical protein
MTLSTGSWGGGIHSDNISANHLLNIKRVAYETFPINKTESATVEFGIDNSLKGEISDITREKIEDIVRRVVEKLDLNNV